MHAHSRPLSLPFRQILPEPGRHLKVNRGAARKLAFVGPKAMLFGMPVAEKLQRAIDRAFNIGWTSAPAAFCLVLRDAVASDHGLFSAVAS